MEKLKTREFVIFDVETTGLSPMGGDRVVEIAALKIKDLKPVARFQTLVDPCRPVSFAAYEVNGISDKMLVGAPRAKDILPPFLKFVGKSTLIGHNIAFDMNFLYNEMDLCAMKIQEEFETIDTIRLARRLMPTLKRYPLWLVADALGIKESQKHRAMADVELTFEVFSRLVILAHEKNMLGEFFG